MWILNWVVSGTFADLDQDPDHHCHRVKNERVKAQKNAARVGAGAVVGARVYLGES